MIPIDTRVRVIDPEYPEEGVTVPNPMNEAFREPGEVAVLLSGHNGCLIYLESELEVLA